MISTEFLLTSLVVVLIPGTGVIFTVSTGLFLGWKSSIAASFGCTAGIIPHLLASILGLSAILHISSLAFQAVKIVGAVYLLYLAWSMWRETGAVKFNESSSKKGFLQIALKGFLINILNPKLSIFFLAFLPLFVSPATETPMLDMLFLSLVFMVMTLIVFIGYGIAANKLSKHITRSPRLMIWIQRSFAIAFAALGARLLATTEQ